MQRGRSYPFWDTGGNVVISRKPLRKPHSQKLASIPLCFWHTAPYLTNLGQSHLIWTDGGGRESLSSFCTHFAMYSTSVHLLEKAFGKKEALCFTLMSSARARKAWTPKPAQLWWNSLWALEPQACCQDSNKNETTLSLFQVIRTAWLGCLAALNTAVFQFKWVDFFYSDSHCKVAICT